MWAAYGSYARGDVVSEGFPVLHLSSSYVEAINLGDGFLLQAGEHVQRGPVRSPSGRVKLLGIEARNGLESIAFQRPHSPFSLRVNYKSAPTIRRQEHTSNTFWSDGLGVSAADVDQVIPSAVPGLDAGRQQVLSIRQVAHPGVANIVVRQLAGFTRARGHNPQGPLLQRLGDHPFVIRRNRLSPAFADAH